MNHERFRIVAEIISAFAVVLSLVFVGLQLRETSKQTALNTVSLQVTAYQDLNAQISHFNELLLDSANAVAFEKLQDSTLSWSDLHGVERRRARSLMYMRVRQADMAFYQFERGMLPQERFESSLRPILSGIDAPLMSAFWKEVGPNQVPAFRKYMDARIAEKLAAQSMHP